MFESTYQEFIPHMAAVIVYIVPLMLGIKLIGFSGGVPTNRNGFISRDNTGIILLLAILYVAFGESLIENFIVDLLTINEGYSALITMFSLAAASYRFDMNMRWDFSAWPKYLFLFGIVSTIVYHL